MFRSAYRQELGTKLSQKPWTQELAKTPDCPRRRAFAEFRLCIGHDCLGTHLHRIGIRPDPYCMLCSLHETVDRNHLRRCTALSSGTECERYWEARTKMMENWLLPFYFCDYLLLGALCLFWMFLMFFSLVECSIYEGWNFNSGNYLFTTDTK